MVTAQIPVDELREQARATTARPGHVLATAIAWLFAAAGFLTGGTWRALTFCAVSARYGYWRGLGLTDEEIGARVRERQLREAPASPRPSGPSKL